MTSHFDTKAVNTCYNNVWFPQVKSILNSAKAAASRQASPSQRQGTPLAPPAGATRDTPAPSQGVLPCNPASSDPDPIVPAPSDSDCHLHEAIALCPEGASLSIPDPSSPSPGNPGPENPAPHDPAPGDKGCHLREAIALCPEGASLSEPYTPPWGRVSMCLHDS